VRKRCKDYKENMRQLGPLKLWTKYLRPKNTKKNKTWFIDGAELESYMLHVKRLALSEGKQRDEEWLLDVVTTNLAEGAMRWFETLEKDQQRDWTLFKKALFEKYPAPAGRDDPPAASGVSSLRLVSSELGASLKVNPLPTSTTQPVGSPSTVWLNTRCGYIKVVVESRPDDTLYISNELNSEGLHVATGEVSKAIRVVMSARTKESLSSCQLLSGSNSLLVLSTRDARPKMLRFATQSTVFPSRNMNSDKLATQQTWWSACFSHVWRVTEEGTAELWATTVCPDEALHVVIQGDNLLAVDPASVATLEPGWEKAKLVLEDK